MCETPPDQPPIANPTEAIPLPAIPDKKPSDEDGESQC
jgi:hypothetical protein